MNESNNTDNKIAKIIVVVLVLLGIIGLVGIIKTLADPYTKMQCQSCKKDAKCKKYRVEYLAYESKNYEIKHYFIDLCDDCYDKFKDYYDVVNIEEA